MTNDITALIMVRPIYDALSPAFAQPDDLRISDLIDRVMAAGTLAGTRLSDTAQRNVIRRVAEIMIVSEQYLPQRIEVDLTTGDVIWPEVPEGAVL